MKQPEDTRTLELPHLVDAAAPAGFRHSLSDLLHQRRQLEDKIRRSKPRGAYAGAVKIGALGHRLRARTGKSQRDFANLAGVSERSLRTWEQATEPRREAPKVHAAIVKALASLGVSYEGARQADQQRRRVAYRHPMTGDTWSGRGLMPKWMRYTLDAGVYTLDQLRA